MVEEWLLSVSYVVDIADALMCKQHFNVVAGRCAALLGSSSIYEVNICQTNVCFHFFSILTFLLLILALL